MFDLLRSMPDLLMLISMIVLGVALIVCGYIVTALVMKAFKRYKMSVLYKYSKLQKENARLRRYINEILGVGRRG